jgi:hypothetical protein
MVGTLPWEVDGWPDAWWGADESACADGGAGDDGDELSFTRRTLHEEKSDHARATRLPSTFTHFGKPNRGA